MTKKIILLIFVLAVFCILVIFYFSVTNNTVHQDTKQIIASNGEEFKLVYHVENFPDESYDIRVYTDTDTLCTAFSGDGRIEGREVQINNLYSNQHYEYYEVCLMQSNENIRSCIFAKDVSERILNNSEPIVTQFLDKEEIIKRSRPYFDYSIFIPLAKNRICDYNEYDYIMCYAEDLIKEGDTEICEIIKRILNGSIKITSEYYTENEITSVCVYLRNKYV